MSLPNNYEVEGQLTIFDIYSPDIWCGKTSPEHSVQTKERTLGASLKKQRKSQIKMPQFLDLRGGGGIRQDVSWVMGGLLLGEYMMHSFGEFPSVENVSLLSQILEETPHQKYSLSAKACQGILRRAEKRGKTLPKMLKEALERQSELILTISQQQEVCQRHYKPKEQTTNISHVQSVSKNEQEKLGGVKESSYSTSEQEPCQHSTTKVYCLQGNGIDRADTAGCNGKGWRENQCYTLNTIDRPAVYSIGHDIRSAKFTDDEITDPLTATDYKDPIKINDCRKTYQDITGILDCGITKGTGNQLANSDMFIANTSVVRRLTPMECERLQGYPDHWTDIGEWTDSKGKLHKDADSPRYKALGNSIALPFWEWMAKRMVSHLNTDHPTMASLFDGIGGFPLVYNRAGCEPIWASEIEEFPIAVTKIRFPEDYNSEK